MKILIADDHSIIRQGLKQIISELPEVSIIDEANDGEEAYSMAMNNDYDLLILDISMPKRSGLEVLTQIKSIKPNLKVLILSVHEEEQYAIRVLKAGALGYLPKYVDPNELKKAILQIRQGIRYITPDLAQKIALDSVMGDSRLKHEKLSFREFEVFRLISLGKTVSQIAEEINLSVKTVSTYRKRILEKMDLDNNLDIIKYALENKII